MFFQIILFFLLLSHLSASQASSPHASICDEEVVAQKISEGIEMVPKVIYHWGQKKHMLENAKKGRDEATKELNLFLNEIKENTGIPFERIFLFGFSQGCMMSLHLAPRKNEKIAGVIGIAGMLMQPELLEKEAVQKPPILLVHGDEDDVVPYEELNIAADTLVKANFEVYTLTSKGAGHSITEDGLRAALQFIKNIL